MNVNGSNIESARAISHPKMGVTESMPAKLGEAINAATAKPLSTDAVDTLGANAFSYTLAQASAYRMVGAWVGTAGAAEGAIQLTFRIDRQFALANPGLVLCVPIRKFGAGTNTDLAMVAAYSINKLGTGAEIAGTSTKSHVIDENAGTDANSGFRIYEFDIMALIKADSNLSKLDYGGDIVVTLSPNEDAGTNVVLEVGDGEWIFNKHDSLAQQFARIGPRG